MVYWFPGLLVYWSTGSLVHRFTGLLVYWFTGSLVNWFLVAWLLVNSHRFLVTGDWLLVTGYTSSGCSFLMCWVSSCSS